MTPASAIFWAATNAGNSANNAAVVALIATPSPPPRFYPLYQKMAIQQFPACVYEISKEEQLKSNDGPTGFFSADFTVTAIATTDAQADAVADALIAALDGQLGVWANLRVQGCFLQDSGVRGETINNPQNESMLLYLREIPFTIKYGSAV